MKPHSVLFAFMAGTALIIAATKCSAAAQPSPAPAPFDVSKVDLSTISEEEIAKTIAHRDALFQEQTDANKKTEAVAKSQAQSLVNAASSSKESSDALLAYQTSVSEAVTKANAAIAALDHVLKKLHLAKWIMTGLALAACALLALQIPPPLGLYAGGAAAVAATTAIWLFL